MMFKEEQKFKQAWVWLIIIPSATAVILYFGYAFNRQLINGVPVGNNPISDLGLIIIGSFTILLMIGITWLFYYMKLIIEIDQKGLHFSYPPMIKRKKSIQKNNIKTFDIREYNAIKEYGGWGIKKISKKSGMAYNVSGKTGMQLILKDGKKVLFGTQRAAAFKRAMAKMMTGEN